jgi:hypothetical protein
MRCAVILRESSHGKPRFLPFSVPALWTKPENHHNDCYFCRCKFTGFGKDYCDKVVYPRVDSVKQPAKHASVVSQCAEELSAGELDNETHEDSREDPSHSLYEPTDSESKYISQPRLNDIARDLGLSKDQSELLASRLQELKLLDSSARVSYFRTRNSVFCQFFAESESVCYCCDIPGLFDAIGCAFDPADWRLFIDGSKYSLKAALVHNGNALPSLPVAYSAQLSESYDSVRLLLDFFKYSKYNWSLCGDLKVVALLLEMQLGNTKYPCFLCTWDSRDTEAHYIKKLWPQRDNFVPGTKNVVHNPIVDPKKFLLPLCILISV